MCIASAAVCVFSPRAALFDVGAWTYAEGSRVEKDGTAYLGARYLNSGCYIGRAVEVCVLFDPVVGCEVYICVAYKSCDIYNVSFVGGADAVLRCTRS